MKTIILKVIEGKGKTGEASTGKKRFLFTNGTIDVFNCFVAEYTNEYMRMFPQGQHTYKTIRKQFLGIMLKYQDIEVMEYKIHPLNTIIRIANISKLIRIPHLDIDKTLMNNI